MSNNKHNIEHKDSKHHTKKQKKPFLKRIFSFKTISTAILVVVIINIFFKVGSIIDTLEVIENSNHGFVTEIGDLKEQMIKMGDDLNEARGFLRLPKNSYVSVDIELDDDAMTTDSNNIKNDKKIQLALFKYVDYLAKNQKSENNLKAANELFEEFLSMEDLTELLTKYEVSIGEILTTDDTLFIDIFYGSDKLLTYSYDKIANEYSLLTLNTNTIVTFKTPSDIFSNLKTFLETKKESTLDVIANISTIKALIDETLESDDIISLLAKREIDVSDEFDSENGEYVYTFTGPNTSAIGKLIFNTSDLSTKFIDLNDTSFQQTSTDMKSELEPFIKHLDTMSLAEKKAVAALAEIKDTLQDSGFNAAMKEYGLKIADEPREDNGRMIFDILNSDDIAISGIALEEQTGVVNIVDTNGKTQENLLFFDPSFQKKNFKIPDVIPNYSNTSDEDINSFNILIAGKHGNLVDTMIFVHIDEVRKDIRMISIPRDLMYKGRKINAYAYFYGMDELVMALSDITGYKLDKYILIDMYSFIDVIDLIGGVDITLKSAVIDPTYRTVDNGVEGTLHYEPGEYHLSGVQALRLARTRHTSSDFARARRQQMILEAIQMKARNFGFGDADTLYEIAKSVLAKTDTDVAVDDAISYYFRYSSYDIKSNNVMSSGNVLYSPPYTSKSKCDAMVAAAKEAGEETPSCVNDNHAYTLQPRDGNWNVIKWFFKQNFED